MCRELLGEIQLAKADVLVRLRAAIDSDSDNRRRRHAHVARRSVQDPTVQTDDELTDRRLRSVDDLVGQRGLARQTVVQHRGEIAESRRGAAGIGVRMTEVERQHRTDVRTRGDRHVHRPEPRAARCTPRTAARRSDRHRNRHGRVADRAETSDGVSTSTAPEPSSWNTINDTCELAASRSELRISAAFEGSSKPLTWTTTIPRVPESWTVAAPAPTAPTPSASATTANSVTAAAAAARTRTWGDCIDLS